MSELTQATVLKLLDYDAEKGVLRWKPRPLDMFKTKRDWAIWNTKNAGNIAGTAYTTNGYLCVVIFNRRYRSHRVIWLYMTGEWPTEQIDHLNHRRDDNRWDNLRTVSHQKNSQNRGVNPRNTSGITGVYQNKGRWLAHIRANGSNIHLGSFDDIEQAAAARKAADIRYGFHTNHGSA